MKSLKNTLTFLVLIGLFCLTGCEKDFDIKPRDIAESKWGQGLEKGFDDPESSLTTASCTIDPKTDHLCTTRILYAGQHYEVGTVKVYCIIGTDEYKIVYETIPGCYISEYHLYAGPEADIPKAGPGNPKIGHFPYAEEGLSAESICVYVGEQADEFTVAAHAVVNCSGDKVPYNGGETAWADGKEFPGGSWATCFDVDCKKK